MRKKTHPRRGSEPNTKLKKNLFYGVVKREI